ncbi:MEDS domain-containing protein [Micromonospora sp. NBC_01796]|uniref:MEDS domain-containing protein n=1 Tax=Micromonospora sp. NBC_01796 TaxID=2975987 RepID=UPI002DD7D47C|nr:MEDS domain-containing protein [Micromonospora sp. NBC_01796]WSA84202.1 MEDS domain-containing protein [Micromonospora sp. NBC_01796]
MADAVPVDVLDAGDHACLTFSDPDERVDIVAAFVAEGLERGSKVVCFTDSIQPTRMLGELALRGVPALDPFERGQLVMVGSDQSWLVDLPLTGAKMVGILARELGRAGREGYADLRVTMDMCWATRPVAAVEELLAFESAAAGLFADGRLTAICQYDRETFDPITLAFAADAHSKVVAAAAYHDDALLRICRQHRPPGIRIAGELDYSRLDPLRQALAEALRLDDDIHVNLTKLRFIDVTAATAIAQAALTLPRERRMIVTCEGQVATMFGLIGARDALQLRVEQAHDPA